MQRHAASCNRILETSIIAKSCQQESQILARQHPSQCICSIPLQTLCFLNLLLPFSFPSLCACVWENGEELLTACCKGGSPLCKEYCGFYHVQDLLQHWNHSILQKCLFFSPQTFKKTKQTSNFNFCGSFSCRGSVLAFHPGWNFSMLLDFSTV